MAARPRLLLASTSPYRRALLARLGLDFDGVAPDVDETPPAGEPPAARAARLARAKALAVSAQQAEALVLGSDQVCALDAEVLRKPGELQAAQLTRLAGREVDFHTAVALARGGQVLGEALVPTRVRFRALSASQIARYVEAEPAGDCAGGFKVEGLGISLFEAVQSQDPTALEGLPLIATCTLLREAGAWPGLD